MYTDITKVTVRQISKIVAKDFIVKHHYSHRFSSCRYALGIYFHEAEDHPFFDGKNESLVGVLTYGHPIGFRTVDSIVNNVRLETDEVLELTRLVILDGYGKNIESYVIGQSFKWLRRNDQSVKILISYADPEWDHSGIIYQATNWYYQGYGLDGRWNIPDYSIREVPDGPWIHSRSVGAKWGVKNVDTLAQAIGHTFWRKEELAKHRYIYFLCGKREKHRFLQNLKYPILSYPDPDMKILPEIQQIDPVDGKIVITILSNRENVE